MYRPPLQSVENRCPFSKILNKDRFEISQDIQKINEQFVEIPSDIYGGVASDTRLILNIFFCF